MSILVKVTDASVRECVLYANLHLRGEDTDQIGTSLTGEISDAFDRWLAEHDVALIERLADEMRGKGIWAPDDGYMDTYEPSHVDWLREKARQRREESDRG